MWTERWSESASWLFVGTVALVHALWLVGWWFHGRRLARSRPVDVLSAGPAVIDGLVSLGGIREEGFTLLLPSGPELAVRVDRLRGWDARRFRAADAVRVHGELRRDASATVEEGDYRSPASTWVLHASMVLAIAEPNPVTRARRASNAALVGGVLGLVVQASSSSSFLVLATLGVPAFAEVTSDDAREVRLHVEDSSGGVDPTGTTEADQRSDGDVPVLWAELQGVRFVQIGNEPGLAADVRYVVFLELAAAVLFLALGLADRERISHTG